MSSRVVIRRSSLLAAGAVLAWSAISCAPPPPPPLPPVIDRFEVAATTLTAPAVAPLAWSVRDPNGDPLTCRVDLDGNGTWDEVIAPCPGVGGRNVAADEGDHDAVLEVSDGTHPAVTATVEFAVGPGPIETYDLVIEQVTPPDPRVTAAVAEAHARWSAVLARGVPDQVVHLDPGGCADSPGFDGAVDDIVIQVAVVPELWASGAAAPCVEGPDGLPRLSIVMLNEQGMDWLHTAGFLDDLVVHEIGHALGFGSAVWLAFAEGSQSDAVFNGPRARAEWSRLGGTGGVPLADAGVYSAHWDETILRNETMTCWLENDPVHPLSAVTVAAMGDIGYHVDLDGSEDWVLPEPGFATC